MIETAVRTVLHPAYPSIIESTAAYEGWMREQIKVVAEDIAEKHLEMAQDPLSFLRGTYYRWLEKFPQRCPELQNAPRVNSVGDLHMNNFGTWTNRSNHGVWGVTDFDEAAVLPYTNDLVRLVTSMRLVKPSDVRLELKDTALAVLSGYQQGLTDGGSPFLFDNNPQIAAIALEQMPAAQKFWKKLRGKLLPAPESTIPGDAKAALLSIMPENALRIVYGHRQAGVGSLGRQRFVVIGEYDRDVSFASEVKALLPPATVFLEGKLNGHSNHRQILQQAVREQDPYVNVQDHWVVRNLAPDRSKIELSKLNQVKEERFLLYSMGYETANVHLGTSNAAHLILADLAKRDSNWLVDAVSTMRNATAEDYRIWTSRA